MSNPDLPDDEIEIVVRPPAEIGARMIILASLLRRAYLEEQTDGDDLQEELFDLRGWLMDQVAWNQATAEERRLFNAPLGSASAEDLAQATMAGEALAAIAWATKLVDQAPDYDRLASTDLLDLIPEPWDSSQTLIDRLDARPDDELEAERERADLWRWRAAIEPDRLKATGREKTEIEKSIRETAQEAAAAVLLPAAFPGEFVLDGVQFRDLPPELQEQIALIAEHRLHALNWLCGFGDDWSTVPLDI